MVTFMVQDSSCENYILVLVDKAGCGNGGYIDMDFTTCGLSALADPIAFLNDPHGSNGVRDAADTTTYNAGDAANDYCGNGTIHLQWTGEYNDGFVVGPLPFENTWSVNMKLSTHKQSGETLETFKIGTYDTYRNEVGFISSNIKKSTGNWGGLQYDAMECTDWCQRYYDCETCSKDHQCSWLSVTTNHNLKDINGGGCVSKDAYIYDYGCPTPEFAPITKFMHRTEAAYEREGFFDGFDAAAVLRFSYDSRLNMQCPCSHRYRYFATLYDPATMEPVYQIDGAELRPNAEHTFVDLPPALDGKTYKIHSQLCIAQGTLGRDDCSPVKIDTFTVDLSPPPPSPPPPQPPEPPSPPPEISSS
jgi:hypothetical protein